MAKNRRKRGDPTRRDALKAAAAAAAALSVPDAALLGDDARDVQLDGGVHADNPFAGTTAELRA